MLIVNGFGFQGNPAMDPQLLHGSLNPGLQYNDSTLLAAAVGTIYVSRTVQTDANCNVVSSSACLWIKVDKGNDCCNGLGSPKDWRRCCCFGFSEGTTVPNGAVEPWCGAQTGDYYLQHSADCGDQLWVKLKDGCAASDWFNLSSKRACVLIGTAAPGDAALCDKEVGSYYLDTATCTLYVKVLDNCGAAGAPCADWIAVNAKPDLCEMMAEKTNVLTFAEMHQNGYLVRGQDGECGYHSPDFKFGFAGAATYTLLPMTNGVYNPVPGYPSLTITLAHPRTVMLDVSYDIVVDAPAPATEVAIVEGGVRVNGVDHITNGEIDMSGDDHGDFLRWLGILSLPAGTHVIQPIYKTFNIGNTPALAISRNGIIAHWIQ